MKWEEWKAGAVIKGRYHIIEKLSSGKVANTYLAIDKNTTKKVVIKTPNTELLNKLNQDEINNLQRNIYQEAVELLKCKHENIVSFIDVFEDKDTNLVCIIMEYVGKESLADFKKSLSQKKALKYIQQIGEALIYLHQNGKVHRNVKPSNILLQEGQPGKAVLIGFRLAREFNHPLTEINTDLSDGFVPKEMSSKRGKIGKFTDVYSLAATLYFLLTGKAPASVSDRNYNKWDNHKDSLQEPKQINSSVSDCVNQAILKGMEIEPEDRPQSVEEWFNLLGLRRCLHGFWRHKYYKLFWIILIVIVVIGTPIGLVSGIITWSILWLSLIHI
jgi:serine/threonine protein kinase